MTLSRFSISESFSQTDLLSPAQEPFVSWWRHYYMSRPSYPESRKVEGDSQPTQSREQSQPTPSREQSQACLALPRREGGRRSQACLGYAMARTDGTAREEAEFTQTIQSRDGRRQKSKRTIKNVMSMSMAGRISEEKSSFLSTYTSLIAVLYGGAAVVYSLPS